MIKILNKINNYFYYSVEEISSISNNEVQVKGKYFPNGYVEIVGSMANDGIYRIEGTTDTGIILNEQLIDEAFEGFLYALKIPKELIDLEVEINEFNKKNTKSNLSSESFGNYSRSFATNKEGNNATWFDVFKDELMPYKRLTSKKGQRGGVKIVK